MNQGARRLRLGASEREPRLADIRMLQTCRPTAERSFCAFPEVNVHELALRKNIACRPHSGFYEVPRTASVKRKRSTHRCRHSSFTLPSGADGSHFYHLIGLKYE